MKARLRSDRKKSQGTRCSNCRRFAPNYDIINLGSIESGSRILCGQCFNAESAKLGGLEKFEHLNFEPVRIVDCDGQVHDFHFRIHLFLPGVALNAFELRDGEPAGYQFQIIGDPEEDLLALFGRLVEKIRRALSIKHLKRGNLGLQVADQDVRGRIEWDQDEDGRVPLLVIDGREITWGALRPHVDDLRRLAIQAGDSRQERRAVVAVPALSITYAPLLLTTGWQVVRGE